MRRPPFPSLGAATVVAILAALLLPILGGWQMSRAREATLLEAERDARTLVHAIAQHAARTLQTVDLVISGAIERLEANPDRLDLQGFLARRMATLKQSHIIVVTDAVGHVIADTAPAHEPLSLADLPAFAWHRDHADRGLHIESKVASDIDGHPSIPLSRRVLDRAGHFAGVVLAALLPDDFQRFYDGLDVGQQGVIALWNEGGNILVRRPTLVAATSFSPQRIPSSFASAGSGIAIVTSALDRVERIVASENVEGSPLDVAVGIATGDALALWRRDAQVEAVVLMLAALALLALAFGLERRRRSAIDLARASRDANRRYRLLAQNTNDLVVMSPRTLQDKVYVSPSCHEMLGWTPEEFAPMAASAFLHPEDVDRLRHAIAALSAGHPRVLTLMRMRHRGGHFLTVEASIQLTTFDDGGEGLIVAARDVTARDAAETALRDSEARYRLLAERSSDMVSRLGLDGIPRYVSPASFEILGRAPETLVGIPPTDCIHPDEAGRVAASLRRMGAGEVDQIRSTDRMLHADGRWVWAEALFRLVRHEDTGEPVEIVSSLRDVSVSHALRQQVEAGAALLRATLAGMSQGLLVTSARGVILVCNGRAAAMLDLVATDPSTPEADGVETLIGPEHAWLFDQSSNTGGTAFERQMADGSVLEVRRVTMAGGGWLVTLSDISHLKRAEDRAREANRHLTMAEEVAHVGHWHLRLDENAVTWSNEVYRIHGLDPAAGAPTLQEAVDFYHPDDRAELKDSLAAAVAAQGNFEIASRIVRRDGEVRHLVSRGRCEMDSATGDVRAMFGVVMDVTDLTRAERELAATAAHLTATLDNMDQGLVKIAADGAIEVWNRRFAELLDLPASLLRGPGCNFEQVLAHLADRGEYSRTAKGFEDHVRRVGAPLTLGTYERSRPDGQVLEVRTVPLPDGAVIRTYADITSRRYAEIARRDSEAQFRMLADATSDVIVRLDLDLQRRYVSSSCFTVLGYTADELLGDRALSLAHPDDAGSARAVALRLAAGAIPGDRATVTYRMRHKAGNWVWAEAAFNLARDPATGAPSAIVCSLRDVSERHRIARELERARAAAETAARVKADFLANMSHELRTPLTGILGVLDLLQADPAFGEAQRRYVDLARAAGASLLSIVNDVLDFSKIEAGELTLEALPFDVGAVIESCRDLMAEQARAKGISLETRVPDYPVTLVGDPSRLRQVVLNLVTNAVKFTAQGGVTVDARYGEDAAILRVEVRDTGIGIPEEKLPLLFERFSQADTSTTRQYGGTGLGLAICRRLVDLMGGTIGIESKPGRGSTFWFEVPLKEARRVHDALAEPSAIQASSGSRILLAEDNLVNQEVIAAFLRQRGHEVVVVGDGAAAAAAVRAGPRFAVVLMDLQMPVVDGLAATRAIRAAEAEDRTAPTPIIGLTANAMQDDVARCRAAGMDAHVAKPVRWSDLFATIDWVAGTTHEAMREAGSVGTVLDDTTLETLAAYIGRDGLRTMLAAFAREVEARLADLASATNAEIASRAHMLVSLAGQLGFLQLSMACRALEADALDGSRRVDISEVQAAADRALQAAITSRHAAAA